MNVTGGETAQCLRMPAALEDDLNLVLSTHVRQLTTFNFTFGDLMPSSGFHTPIQTQVHIIKNKKNTQS